VDAKPVILHEVGPRDGLQAEDVVVPTATKIRWIERLASSGIDMIQVGSFVHKEKMPQMADTDDLFAHFSKPENKLDGVTLTGLVLNEKGLDRGLACGASYFCMGVSASDTHSRKNTGMSTAEATDRIIATAKRALAAGARVQVSVQSAFGCGYEGKVPEERVLSIVGRYLEAGFTMVSLADTAGHADPQQVERLFGAVRKLDPSVECACHLHDTYGLGLANAYAALRAGVRYFESAFAGLGGCPFTAVTGGNVGTDDLVHMFHRMGLRADVKLEPIVETSREAAAFFGRELPGVMLRTGPIPEGETR
jgi:hydroxymethylglutaryl-CoA lyase